MRSLPFRTRLALATAVAVAVTVILASAVAYLVAANGLQTQADDTLRERLHVLHALLVHAGALNGPTSGLPSFPQTRFATSNFFQVVTASGQVIRPADEQGELPVTSAARAIARGIQGQQFTDMSVQGIHLRVVTAQVRPGYAVQIALPLTQIDVTLGQLRLYFLLIAAGGIVLAAMLGAFVARTALVPVRRLTRTAEEVTATRDLSRRIVVGSSDELGRLATSFNTMLGALEQSVAAQRQLVADASHELRTPLTSLRTNIEVLQLATELDSAERGQILADVVGQIEEVTQLVGDIVELARDQEQPREVEELRLDLLVADAIARVARHHTSARFETLFQDTVVTGSQQQIERAVTNLLDNAAKWSPQSGTIEVLVGNGSVTVRDHGPGIAPEDLPHIFDRFYRSAQARGMPGSGLGLAIVRQVAETHGGAVGAMNAHDGGAILRLSFPTSHRLT
jgi:two-component system sensor histidine kinase MprB